MGRLCARVRGGETAPNHTCSTLLADPAPGSLVPAATGERIKRHRCPMATHRLHSVVGAHLCARLPFAPWEGSALCFRGSVSLGRDRVEDFNLWTKGSMLGGEESRSVPSLLGFKSGLLIPTQRQAAGWVTNHSVLIVKPHSLPAPLHSSSLWPKALRF